jgi:hypothetical protein
MTEEEQIKKQHHLDKTDYEGTLITPGIVSHLFITLNPNVERQLIPAPLQLHVWKNIYGITVL